MMEIITLIIAILLLLISMYFLDKISKVGHEQKTKYFSYR